MATPLPPTYAGDPGSCGAGRHAALCWGKGLTIAAAPAASCCDASPPTLPASPLALRRGLRKKGVGRGIVVVFSDEPVQRASLALTEQTYKRSFYG